MSASLVGSEMCIRDRRLQRGPPGVEVSLATRTADVVPDADERLGRQGGCLLYTSDAADDM
eukprot:15243948-Alexandrium_andersonii.AAC.1